MYLKKIGMFLLFVCVAWLIFTPVTYACDAFVDASGQWVQEDGIPATEEEIAICETSSTSVSFEENYKLLRIISIVSSLLLVAFIPVFFIALLILIIFAVQKRKLKGPLMFLGIATAIPVLTIIIYYGIAFYIRSKVGF